ncbi:MAG: bifunctional aldolase/short-chain dehydrogenase [Alphaproteobacteria bacterium]|nr:bifunctional aldolase/short-chain dehydrogenase [Alphaproteobacteria bacterium]
MENLWSDRDAEAAVARWGAEGVCRDLALRVYTTRLLGGEPRLVLHGGGNTSLKTRMTDLAGDEVAVLRVKGSGWDMARIEPPGLPAVRLAPLRRLRSREALSDEDMVAAHRANLLDPAAPTPSVETLLHAFLPHRYIDHTHANAVLALTDQPDGAALCREVFGDKVALVPYIMPGFQLARKAAEVFEKQPDCEGMILLNHGVFTFGETAQESYERTIRLATLAEAHLAAAPAKVFASAALPERPARPEEIAPILRGLLARPPAAPDGGPVRFLLAFRGGEHVRRFVDGAEVARYGLAGTVTPDHSLRVKSWPVLLPPARAGGLEEFAQGAGEAIRRFEADYMAYFERGNARAGNGRTALDPAPRVLLAPGVGLFAAGRDAKSAAIAADLAEAAVEVITDAERIGRFTSIGEKDLFDIEYWPLEQAKLGKAAPPPLAGQVAVVTGAAGAIGQAVMAAFRAEGADAVGLDLKAGPDILECDVTWPEAVEAAFAEVCRRHGGVDILVSNAGAAWQGRIGEVGEEELRRSFELNFFAHQAVAQAAVRIMQAQGTGGSLLFNVSKQAVNPGPDFGPYGVAKAATLALMRQYAIDYGRDGISSNAVNADRIRSGLLDDAMVSARAKTRGLSEEDYMRGNLLGREVLAEDVARAFTDLARARKTTGAVLTVDGGNIAAAMR